MLSQLETAMNLGRREILRVGGLGITALTLGAASLDLGTGKIMNITCFIRYQIDPFQKEAFRAYATKWGSIIPRLGGHLIGYFLPDEGTNDIGWALIAFKSLAEYEAYRERLRVDPEARSNFEFAQRQRFVLREERTFLEIAPGTFGLSAQLK